MHRQTSSTRVLRSRRPDASDAQERDADFVPVAVQRFVAALQTLRITPSPSSTFVQTHRTRFAAVAEAQRYAVQRWVREGQRSATWDAQFFPRQALREIAHPGRRERSRGRGVGKGKGGNEGGSSSSGGERE